MTKKKKLEWSFMTGNTTNGTSAGDSTWVIDTTDYRWNTYPSPAAQTITWPPQVTEHTALLVDGKLITMGQIVRILRMLEELFKEDIDIYKIAEALAKREPENDEEET